MTTLISPAVTVLALVVAVVCAGVAWRTVRAARRQAEDRVAALAAAIHDIGPGVASDRDGADGLAAFSAYDGEVPPYEPLRRTPAVFAFGAATLATVLVGAVIWNAGAATTPVREARPLELARLQHGVTSDAFTVSGEVAVPEGRSVDGLAVELVTLDQQGRTIASGGSPVMATVDAPRGHVPFSVSVPYSSDVSRYTIRFRDAAGLRPHVDRRRVQVTRR